MLRGMLQLMAAATQKQLAPSALTAQLFQMHAHKVCILCTASPAIHSCELELASILAEAHPLNLAILYGTNEL